LFPGEATARQTQLESEFCGRMISKTQMEAKTPGKK